ncbi:MAG: hypothetical protein EHM60_09110 [Lysobacterales bacterium]|nr:MAG: hypothetical protein EHM60_09110 [Xanthomonadales bacterium]
MVDERRLGRDCSGRAGGRLWRQAARRAGGRTRGAAADPDPRAGSIGRGRGRVRAAGHARRRTLAGRTGSPGRGLAALVAALGHDFPHR